MCFVVFAWLFPVSLNLFLSSMSRTFITVVVMNFDKSTWLLKYEITQLFCVLIIFSQWSSGVCVSDCFAQKSLLVNCIYFASVISICDIAWLFIPLEFCPARFDVQVILLGALLRATMPKSVLS